MERGLLLEMYIKKVNNEDHLIDHAYEWITDGWGLEGTISNEQVVAALLMEAITQDDCVKKGESNPQYPARLREVAFKILEYCGHRNGT